METPVQQAHRLVHALEQLVEQEGMYLRGGYYDLAVEIRGRTAPVVEQLVRLGAEPGVGDLRARIEAVVNRSAGHATFLQEKMTELTAEIRQIQQARQRSTQVRPAYGRARTIALPRFQATG